MPSAAATWQRLMPSLSTRAIRPIHPGTTRSAVLLDFTSSSVTAASSFSTIDDPDHWRGLPEDPLQTAVGVLLRNHPATLLHKLPITRRLDSVGGGGGAGLLSRS